MPFSYFQRLNRKQKEVYRLSDRITSVLLPDSPALTETVSTLERTLETGRRLAAERAAQTLVDRLTVALGVSPLRVRVLERRPSWSTGELHGLYRPNVRGGDQVSVWMRTAGRAQIVKFRTFLRTVLHELCHHLDYERFGLADSFHTEGFYKRESSLLHQLLPSATPATPLNSTRESLY